MLTVGDEIRSLLGRYCRLIDAGDFEGLGELMAAAVLRTDEGVPLARGRQEVAALYRRLVVMHADGTPGTHHIVAGTELAPDGDRVTARSSYLVLQALPDLPLQPIATGSYRDTFDRADGRWRFVERRLSLGRAGRLDHHLAPGALS